MLRENYRMIMDPKVNLLWRLPKILRIQYMSVLAFMWSTVFTVWTGWISSFGPPVVCHLILLVGVFFTADVFRCIQQRVRQPQPVHHRDAMHNKSDGTTLYDDRWGAPLNGADQKDCGHPNLVVVGEPVFAFYNPPWTLPFLRRNEVIFQLASK